MPATKNPYKKKVLLIAGVVILLTSLHEYFNGYKDHHIISEVLFFLNFASWITIWYTLFYKQLERKTVSFKHNKSKWLNQKVNNGFLFIILLSFFCGNLYVTQELGHTRVVNILNNE